MLSEKIIILLLFIGIIIFGSIKAITIPIFVSIYPSILFLLIIISTQFILIYGLIFVIKYSHLHYPINKSYPITFSGISLGFATICLAYSSNPAHTPIIIQSIFQTLIIIPSVIFTKLILKKNINYHLPYILLSLMLLGLSTIISMTPLILYDNNDLNIINALHNNTYYSDIKNNFFWITVYFFGIIFLSLSNIFQEKYFMITDDKSIANISRLLTFTNITQLLVFIIFCWIELFLGNYNTLYGASIAFYESLIIFITIFSKSFIIELFVIVSVMTYYFSAYLNTISTNYNMLLINIINQLVPIFFLIFPQFNNGIKFPFYIILLSLVFNI